MSTRSGQVLDAFTGCSSRSYLHDRVTSPLVPRGMWGGGQNRLPHSLNGSFIWSSFDLQGRKCVTNYFKKKSSASRLQAVCVVESGIAVVGLNNYGGMLATISEENKILLSTDWQWQQCSCSSPHSLNGSFLWSTFEFTRTEVCNQLLSKKEKKLQQLMQQLRMAAAHHTQLRLWHAGFVQSCSISCSESGIEWR
jgi:hypothetical protein